MLLNDIILRRLPVLQIALSMLQGGRTQNEEGGTRVPAQRRGRGSNQYPFRANCHEV